MLWSREAAFGGEEDGGYRMHGWNTAKEIREVVIESRYEATPLWETINVLYNKSRVY